MKKLIWLLSFVALFMSCKTGKEMVYNVAPVDYEEEYLDTLTVTAPYYSPGEEYSLPVYNGSELRRYDIIHTDLSLTFDWLNQQVNGVATIDLTPLFYPLDQITLDAQNFEIHSVSYAGQNVELAYEYDNEKLEVFLGKTYKKGNPIKLTIRYTAKPNEGEEGGSSAITSDKGLFFINPLGTDPIRPQQIWTQGETENNSRWFPTFDKPNERMTQSIIMTVADKFKTLSNGKLIRSVRNNDGSRTDTWMQDKPHAPYLAMIAVGDFSLEEERWNGKPIMYMVNSTHKNSAKEIFNHTPEMLTFFSEVLNYDYPWDKYAQIVATDYVSGAMENTGAVIFGDFVQKTKRELIDNDNDAIVAHEMFHHWFGDLVTCESWANLTLNEGFANYAEYLWFEHKYGTMRADQHRVNEINGYLQSYQNGSSHPMIHYGYDDKEDMFDAHSYNKGGLILHMLRSYVGDEAFFASLNKYLKDNEYSSVEIDELRMAFEDTVGEDLNWFFDQWYFNEGHPVLKIDYDYSPQKRMLNIYIEQKQDPENNLPVYILPTDVAVYNNAGKVSLYPEWVEARNDTIRIFNINERPSAVVLDGGNNLLAIKDEKRSVAENIALFQYSDNFIDKLNALKMLTSEDTLQTLIPDILKEPFFAFRSFGINHLNPFNHPELLSVLEEMASSDSHSSVRSQAVKKLSYYPDYNILPIAEKVLSEDQAYPVINAALKEIFKKDSALAERYADILKEEPTSMLLMTIGEIFQKSENTLYLPWFQENLEEVNVFQMFNFWGAYGSLLKKAEDAEVMKGMDFMVKYATNMENNSFQRFIATNTLHQTRSGSQLSPKAIQKLTDALNLIISKETNPDLLERYNAF